MKHRFVCLATLIALSLSLPVWGGEPDSEEKKPAIVIVRLPADAELIIAGVKSQQNATVREFDTPPLTPGKKFSYVVKAAWKDGDKEVTRETTIFVKAGETTEVDLLALKLSPPHAEKIPSPEVMSAEETQAPSKVELEKKPEGKNEPEKKTEAKVEKKPETKPEPEKKPELKLEPQKSPAISLEPEKQPEAKLEQPKTAPQPKPKPEAAPESPRADIEVPAPKQTLSLMMPESVNLQPGATKLLPIKVMRTHCEGPVTLTFEGLPPGLQVSSARVAAEKQKGYITVTARADTEEQQGEVKVIGTLGSVRQESTLKIKIAR